MAEITDEEAADLSPIESGPIKGEWIREVIDNPKVISKIVDKVERITYLHDIFYDKNKVKKIKELIPTYDQEDFAGLSQIAPFVVERLGSDAAGKVDDEEFMYRVLRILEEQVATIKDEEVLKDNKIVPIHLPNSDDELSAFLGSGSFGRVFRAAYKGKQVAVKIVARGLEDRQWENLKHLSDSAPPEIKKHLPAIYEIIPGKESTLIVMELLRPTSKDLSSFFEKGETSKSYTVKDLFSDQEFIWEIHKEVLLDMPGISQSLAADLAKVLFQFSGASVEELQSFIRSKIATPLSQQQARNLDEYIEEVSWRVHSLSFYHTQNYTNINIYNYESF